MDRSGTRRTSHFEETRALIQSGAPVVPTRSFSATSRVSVAIADAKVESLKNGTSNANRIAVGAIGAIGGLICLGFVAFLIVRVIRRPLPEQDEEDETSKRALPETLLDEMEFESPLTLANTAVNADFELEVDDFCA
jgi:hypothetical protein